MVSIYSVNHTNLTTQYNSNVLTVLNCEQIGSQNALKLIQGVLNILIFLGEHASRYKYHILPPLYHTYFVLFTFRLSKQIPLDSNSFGYWSWEEIIPSPFNNSASLSRERSDKDLLINCSILLRWHSLINHMRMRRRGNCSIVGYSFMNN